MKTIRQIILVCVIFLLSGCSSPKGEIYPIQNETQTDVTKEVSDIECGYVYLSGEVICPGVYRANENSRIYEMINAAGGVTENADISNINMASVIFDGMRIHIPSINTQDSSNDTPDFSDNKDRININTASKEELMNLPGVGESRANAIVKYRESNGYFQNPEDIMNVSGIKQKMYESLESLICVR